MLKRIPPPIFWIVLSVVVFALGYSVFTAMQPEDPGREAATTVAATTAAHPSATATGRRPLQPAVRPTAPGASHPAQTVALVPRAGLTSGSRWAPAADFSYNGHWEHVTQRYDGRSNGSSSRSFRPGSQAALTFTGRAVRLFGIVGPGGGLGDVQIDGRVKRMVDFYAATKSVHKLVFSSPPLGPGTHHLTLSVVMDEALPVERSHYVNIDGAEIDS